MIILQLRIKNRVLRLLQILLIKFHQFFLQKKTLFFKIILMTVAFHNNYQIILEKIFLINNRKIMKN